MQFEIIHAHMPVGAYMLLGPDGQWKFCASADHLKLRIQAAILVGESKEREDLEKRGCQ